MRPTSIAVVGGGAWCASVIAQAELMGFDGPVWPVHPSAAMVGGHGAFPTVPDLPGVPDAVFVGVNRHATIDVVHELAAMGAGGAVCFASGFAEAAAEDADAGTLQDRLLAAAGDMPILGPNCYGFINALDGALLWPDQHGCVSVDRGVAVLTQSSNIAINLTMQQRALPVAYAVACGNMAQTSQAQIASALLEDPRVTAIGLHVEGFGDIRAWEALAQEAYARRVPLVVLKVGTSELARGATVSHTASLAGSDPGAQALLDRLGIPRVPDLPTLLETLKLLHCHGPLDGRRVASISCSGGEASLMADMADGTGLTFPPLSKTQAAALRDALGPLVALGNPLDYHTYIWRDAARMAAVWAGMTGPGIDMTLSVVDYPVTDASDWTCATQAALQVRADTGRPFALVASLPELMPADTARQLMAGGVVPFCGMAEALAAVEAAARLSAPTAVPVALAGSAGETALLTEAEAKSVLAAYGLAVPRHVICPMAEAKADWDGPSAVKGVGLAHKSEAGAVRLNVDVQDVPMVARGIGTDTVLVEEMIRGTIAELIIGVIRDRVHGFVLTLGAGGVLTEVLRDTVSLLLPVTEDDVRHAVLRLRCAALLQGYRGAPPADMAGITQAVMAVQSYVLEHTDTVSEVEINPLICTPDRAVGVDALIRKA